MINVFADRHLYKISDYLSDNVNLTLFDPNAGPTEIPVETQAMLIRTVTKINPETFPQFPDSLSFIGTGSAGTDHVDQQYLKNKNITFTNAAGCNARSVGEYVTTALLLWAENQKSELAKYNVGIIGVGHTGSEVYKILQNLDVQTCLYDPPRENEDSTFTSDTLKEVLKSDILTFHTPLNRSGKYPTYHWLDEEKLKNQKFELIINASRGGVVNEQALLNAFKKRRVKNYILDVWENEPLFDDETARRAYTKTPHIAGYSIQAKKRATSIILQAMTEHFSEDFKLQIKKSQTAVNKPNPDTFWSLTDVLTYYHPIHNYETRIRMLVGRSDQDKAKDFNRIRTEHPLRNEFKHLNIPDSIMVKFPILGKLVN